MTPVPPTGTDASAVSRFAERHGLDLVELAGFSFLRTTEAECVAAILDDVRAGEPGWVITPNTDVLRIASRDEAAAQHLRAASVVVADGMPLIWASRVQRTPLPDRVTGSNLIDSVAAAAARHGRSVFLLGGADDTAVRAGEVLVARHDGLDLRGTHAPPFGFESSPSEMDRIRLAVEAAGADIVFVALPFPKGEDLVAELRQELPPCWYVDVGVSFSFVAGDLVRPPGWIQRLGLEWTARLVQEPRRMARRYLRDDVPFAIGLLRTAVAHRGERR